MGMVEKETPVKLAFVGTSCIGKTTLLEEYGRRLNGRTDAVIVPEAARVFFTDNPSITEKFAKEAQRQVQSLALQQEQEVHNAGARLILCDRSVIDAVVYVRAHGDTEGAAKLLDRVSFWIPTYNKFLLLNPADVLYKTDDVRQEDEYVRQSFHEAYLEFFQESGIPYELLSGTLEERIARVDELVNE